MKKINWFIFTFLAFAIISCDDDEATLDTEDPTITITAPTSNQELNNDEQLQVRATVRDNLGLDEVTVWVTPPGGAAQQVFSEPVSDFLNDSREATIDETVNLGTGNVAAGSYIITVRAVDERGNEAEESVTINVREADANAPTITITSPEAGATYQLGSDMIISALVEEDMNLGSINVMVSTGNEDPIVNMDITEFDAAGSHQIQDTVTIPSDAPVGTYTLMITAVDVAGNEVEESLTFQVTEAGARTATFVVTGIPANTPEGENLFISGEFADGTWIEPGTDERFMLTRNDDGTFSTTLELSETTEVEGVNMFKIAREGGWGTVEVAADCAGIDNRELATDVNEMNNIEVAAWEDLCQ